MRRRQIRLNTCSEKVLDSNIDIYEIAKIEIEEYECREKAHMESEINTYRINNFDSIKRNREEDLSFEMQQFIKIELDPVHYMSQVIRFNNMNRKTKRW